MRINDVEIEDTYAEAFPMYFGRVLITAVTRRWALASAQSAVGGGGGATLSESGLECEVAPKDTPDGRPGYIILVGRRFRKDVTPAIPAAIRNNVVPVPTAAAFNAMPDKMTDYFVEIENTPVQLFGDSYEEIVEKYGRKMYKIPRMDGFFYTDTKYGVRRGVGGGNFLIMGESQAATILSAEVAIDAIKQVLHVRAPTRPAASGSKVGGRVYKDAYATTNDKYCACIADKVEDTRIPDNVNCILEIVIDGLTLNGVKKAIAVGIKAATKMPGIKKITAVNFEGALGKINIGLYEALQN